MLDGMKRMALLLSLVLSLAAIAQEISVREAVVFKNGLAFVTRQGTVAFRDGEARVAPAPDALLGTLWVGAGERPIDGVRAFKEDAPVDAEATSVAALLDANVGRKVSLLIDDREYTGTLVKAPPSLVLLQIDGRVHAFSREAVKSAAFAEVPSLKVQQPGARTVLSIRAKGASASELATIRYLRSGLSWIPEYTIELLDAERARVTMKATLINDAEDLRDSRVRFAVGYPNFEFSGVPSPMTLQQTLQQFLTALGGNSFARDRFENVMTQQIMVNSATAAGDVGRMPPGPPAEGESAEDLFFYQQDGVTLAKGERGMFPVLSEVMPVRHVYQWTVGAGDATDRVWHSISLANRGTTPWTTAPAFVVANGKPLAQDTLPYTAAGSTAEVKLTLATDVAVERTETEIERKPRDLQRSGYSYDLVVIEGTLTMRNFKREAIALDVTTTIEGQSTLRQPEGKVTRLALQPRAVNPTERIEWQVPIPAGEERTVKYRYRVWARE